jgi:hypothetical protein
MLIIPGNLCSPQKSRLVLPSKLYIGVLKQFSKLQIGEITSSIPSNRWEPQYNPVVSPGLLNAGCFPHLTPSSSTKAHFFGIFTLLIKSTHLI